MVDLLYRSAPRKLENWSLEMLTSSSLRAALAPLGARHCSSAPTSHLQRTANEPRKSVTTPARVDRVADLTPTTKLLTLCILDAAFSFSPGQWVDFSAPGVERVGGYTICSTPGELARLGRLDLAVKRSERSAPAAFCHSAAALGAEVQLRVGGGFTLTEPLSRRALFVAGGVGINPIVSILRHQVSEAGGLRPGSVLLFSASAVEELAFCAELEAMPGLECRFFVTRGGGGSGDGSGGMCAKGRIPPELLRTEAEAARGGVWVCGPPAMTDWAVEECSALGAEVHFERWW